MQEDFISFITLNGLAATGDKILLGVSGGVDSMVMADLFISSGFNVGIAHCNFKLRGKESDADEKLVEEYASSRKKAFHSISFRTKPVAKERGITVQMAARELRHAWFEKILKEHGYDLLALAHNKSDRAETILLNLARGTGIAGMAAMKPRNSFLIRPLLFAAREDILKCAVIKKIPWREDRSNRNQKYTRNKIRHAILPHFRQINPSFDDTVCETAERFSEYEAILSEYFAGLKEKIVRYDGNEAYVDINKLKSLPAGRSLLFEIFTPYGLIPAQLGDLSALRDSQPGKRIITPTHAIYRDRKEIIITPLQGDAAPFHIINGPGDFLKVGSILHAGVREISHPFKPADRKSQVTLDSDLVRFPVTVRKWEHGDRFIPLGMNNFKKLSDYFTDRKFSVLQKERMLVVESGGMIIALLGERIDNRFRVTAATRRVLEIIVKEDRGAS